MVNIFGPSYIKHTMTVGGSVLGVYLAKTKTENNTKITCEHALKMQREHHAQELVLQQQVHANKMEEILLEQQGQQAQVVINKTSLFSASEENYWDFLGNSVTNSLDSFVELTVGPGNEIYLIFCFWLFTLCSLLNIKLLQNLFQKEGVFVENPRLASLFIISDKTALFFFLYASMTLLFVFYTDCIVLENLKLSGLIIDCTSRTSEIFTVMSKSVDLIREKAVFDNNLLNSQIDTLINEIGTITEKVNSLTEKNEELQKQIEELSRKK